MDQSVQKHVRPFFATQSSDPPNPERFCLHAEGALRRRAIEGWRGFPPRVLDEVYPVRWDPILGQPLDERARDHGYCVKPAVSTPLQVLVQPVLPSATREAVYRRDGGDAEPTPHPGIYQVGAVPVGIAA